MTKRILSLMLAAFIAVGIIPSFAAESDAAVMVVNMAAAETAKASGLTMSQMYVKKSDYSLRLSDSDTLRNIHLPSKSDWSMGNYLEFWVYSTVQSNSSFGLAVISDNDATKCIDYYETVVSVGAKGWQLVSVPLSEMKEVYKPKGFNSVDRVEIWPVYGKYSVSSSAILYFDSMYVTREQSQTTEQPTEKVLFDLSSKGSIEAANINNGHITETSSGNLYAETNTPDTGGASLCWCDKKKDGTNSNNGIDFRELPTEDFTPYNTLEMSIYSKQASGDVFRLVLWSDADFDKNNDGRNSYYYLDIPVDWEGRKNFQVKLGALQASNTAVVGKNFINRISFWWQNINFEDNSSSTLYINRISLREVDYNELWTQPVYLPEAPKMENNFDFAAKIKERFPNNQHPRLIATQADIERIKNTFKDDEYLNKSVEQLLKNSDAYAETVDSPGDTRTASTRAATLALAYLLTGEEKYANAVWEKMKVLTTDTSTWDPGAASELSVGDTSRFVAVTYDLMYNHWTEEQRLIARNAMVMYALEPQRGEVIRNNSGHGDGVNNADTNWNAVINSGLGMCALALADTPGYEETSNQYLNRLYLGIRNLFRHYAPDGAGFEGTDYWAYTMSGYLPYENALYNSVGDENYLTYSIFSCYGMDKTGDYILQMHGPTGAGTSFNYYDGSPRLCKSSGDFWLARYFEKPEYAGLSYENPSGNLYEIMMYRPNEGYKTWRNGDLPLDYFGGGEAQVGSMRASFDKGNNGFYVAYKGNMANTATHGRLDAGTFVLDAMGTRWAELFSSENYNLPGMFGSERYKYYRNRAEGNNTLVIGKGIDQGSNKENDSQASPEALLDQVRLSEAPLVERGAEKWASYGIIDLTDAYKKTAKSVKRGFALINSRNAFLLQDEITTSENVDIHSFVHTSAVVEVAEDGQSAIFTKDNQQIKVSLMSTCNARLEKEDAAPFSTSPAVENTVNGGYCKLAVNAEVNGSATVSLLFTPYLGEGKYSFGLDNIVPLSNWKAFLEKPVQLSALYLDGIAIREFSPDKTVYTLSEDSCGVITASAENNVKVKVTQAEKVGDSALVTANDGNTETTYVISFSDKKQKMLDEWNSYPPKAFLSSSNPADVPNITDGDFNTEWANEGSQWVAFDLGKEKLVHEVQLYWKNQHLRTETFDIQVSNDGENWQTVFSGDSILSNNMEKYGFEPVMARYVKVQGYKNSVNNWTTIMEMRVTYSGSSFDDLEGCWAEKAIEDMSKVGMLDGTAERIYSPESNLSRAEFLTMLSRVFSVPQGEYSGTVSDVSENDWFMPYVEGAKIRGIIPEEMLSGGIFKPESLITREEMAALSVMFYEKYANEAQLASVRRFSDKKGISEWALEYVEKCLALRFMSGISEDEFAPKAYASRAEAAAIIKRIYIKYN